MPFNSANWHWLVENLPSDNLVHSPIAKDGISWHSMMTEQVLSHLESSKDGLNEEEIPIRHRKYGKNELRKAARRSPVAIFAKQFVSPLILILLAATIISAVLGEILDAVIIMIIVVLAAVVSFVQEYRSEKAIEALRQITSPTAGVIRNRRHATIRSEDIVPGDIIIVFSQGDRVPADAYLLDPIACRPMKHRLQANPCRLKRTHTHAK